MARPRMYLFERAYVDYLARLRRFVAWEVAAASRLWRWFWRGRGADGIEMLLRLLLVAAAVTVAVLYARYEAARGRGTSAGTFGALAVLLIFTSLLLWAWKAPLHFTARLVSGALACGLVLTLGLAAAGGATLAFAAYFVTLLLLTAASFLVFVPLRGGQEAWLLYRRVAYRCPYDDCAWSGLPIHVCSCGERYPDLLPSFYGIFHHTCRHPAESVKLPTLDLLGRNRLPRLCGGCERPLIHSSVGELPEWPIAVVGGASAGKTVFLLQATRQLDRRLAARRGTVRIDAEEQASRYRRELEGLDRGAVAAKTAGDVVQAIGLAVRVPPRLRCLLYLFDAPGEHFATLRRVGQKQALRHLRGIVLLVDSFSLPALADGGRWAGLSPSQTPLRDVVHNLIHSVNLMLLRRPEERCDVPVAVVLSKADAFPERDYPFLAGLYPRNGDRPDAALSARCREALERLGEGASVRALEQKFTRLCYFACTALGRMPDPRDTRPFEPRGVAEPLLWLLDAAERKTGAENPRGMS